MAYSKAIWATILLHNFLYILKRVMNQTQNDATLFATAAANPITSPIASPTAGPAAIPPIPAQRGSSMYILHAYDYWCKRRHVIMSSCHHADKKKSVLGGQRNSIYNINIIYTISLDPLFPIFPKSLSAWWHDDITTWWHDGETRKNISKCSIYFFPRSRFSDGICTEADHYTGPAKGRQTVNNQE